jgi:hypothetical protein
MCQGALLIALRKFGLTDIRDQHERIQEQAFSSEHKFMMVTCLNAAGVITHYMKVLHWPVFFPLIDNCLRFT